MQVRSASWRAAYDGLVAEEVLAELPDEPSEAFVRNLARPRPYSLTLVAEKGPNVIGFATIGWDRKECDGETIEPGCPGEVWAIYVHPDHWGRRAGYALLREAHRALGELGLLPIRVWELEGNQIGRRFYERYGFVADGERSEVEFGGAALPVERLSLPKDRQVEDLT